MSCARVEGSASIPTVRAGRAYQRRAEHQEGLADGGDEPREEWKDVRLCRAGEQLFARPLLGDCRSTESVSPVGPERLMVRGENVVGMKSRKEAKGGERRRKRWR